jgi:hypothetical protein
LHTNAQGKQRHPSFGNLFFVGDGGGEFVGDERIPMYW